MGEGFSVQVTGIQELRAAMKRISPEARKAFDRRLREVARQVRDDARQRAPRLSGELASSIGYGVQTRRGVFVRATARHAGLFEFGGRHPVFGNRDVWVDQPARPFLRPAVEAHRDAAVQAVEEALFDAIKEAGFDVRR